jgi:hypothetical protein
LDEQETNEKINQYTKFRISRTAVEEGSNAEPLRGHPPLKGCLNTKTQMHISRFITRR